MIYTCNMTYDYNKPSIYKTEQLEMLKCSFSDIMSQFFADYFAKKQLIDVQYINVLNMTTICINWLRLKKPHEQTVFYMKTETWYLTLQNYPVGQIGPFGVPVLACKSYV